MRMYVKCVPGVANSVTMTNLSHLNQSNLLIAITNLSTCVPGVANSARVHVLSGFCRRGYGTNCQLILHTNT